MFTDQFVGPSNEKQGMELDAFDYGVRLLQNALECSSKQFIDQSREISNKRAHIAT